VISIQSIMLVALGFLSATLLGLLIAPAFWRRAVRLTTRRLKEQLPLSDAEIRADKDRLRAEYAIRVHKLEMKVEQANLQKARDTIEINRRDSAISQLEQERGRLRSAVEENQNARLVLEQTVADRLPKVESRLNEAKQLLFSRDREIAELTQSTTRQQLALEEAHSINKQQTSELDRLTTALTVRGARNQDSLSDPNYDGELALRSEIEALRAKTREQAGLIGRLQSQQAQQMGVLTPLGEAGPAPIGVRPLSPAGPEPRGVERPAGNGLSVVSMLPDDARLTAEREIRSLRARADDQSAEIARLSSELETFKSNDEGSGLKDSKIALKARLNAAQSQSEQNTETIKRLRAELAAANERLALQGAHFMEQMRRLGAGTLPANGQTRRPVTQNQKLTLQERVAQSRPQLTPITQAPTAQTPDAQTPITQLTAAPVSQSVSQSAEAQRHVPAQQGSAQPTAPPVAMPIASNGTLPVVSPSVTPLSPLAASNVVPLAPVEPQQAQNRATGEAASEPEPSAVVPAAEPAPRKPRLIDRISSINKA
jgi:hypothetical protein